MSSDPIGRLRAVYEAWSGGEFDASLALLDEHVMLVIDPTIPDGGGAFAGVAGVREYMRVFLGSWSRAVIEGVAFEQSGDTVIVRVHQTATGRGGGVPVEMDYFHLWTFRGDRVVRVETVLDEGAARAAAGL